MEQYINFDAARKEVIGLIREYTGNQDAAYARFKEGTLPREDFDALYAKNEAEKKAVQAVWRRIQNHALRHKGK